MLCVLCLIAVLSMCSGQNQVSTMHEENKPPIIDMYSSWLVAFDDDKVMNIFLSLLGRVQSYPNSFLVESRQPTIPQCHQGVKP